MIFARETLFTWLTGGPYRHGTSGGPDDGETVSSIDPDNFSKAYARALSECVTVAPAAFGLSAAFAYVDEDPRIAWVLFDDGTFAVYR